MSAVDWDINTVVFNTKADQPYEMQNHDHIDFEDSQTFPNKVRIDLGPMVTGGLQIKF